MRPANEAELSTLLRDRTAPLRIRGGGTRTLWFGEAAEVLDCSALSGITLYEPGALTLVAGAGTPLAEAIITTVAQGGDTDTNAAICGALLGAAEGRSALPVSWQSRILGCRALPLPHVTHPRPATYWPDDAMDLAEALLTFADVEQL